MSTQKGKKTLSLFVLGALLILLLAGIFWQAGGADTSNPRGNFWRVVRHGIPAYSSTPQQGHTVLIVNSGENWRAIRNGLLMPFSQWLLVLALAVLGVFYKYVGPDRLEEPRTGVMIERYTRRERILHWYTAFLFIAMAVTGLSLLLGRLLLIPVFGHSLQSSFLQMAKILHNYFGPLLVIGFILEFFFWVRINIPQKADLGWFRNMGGMLHKKGPRAHTGKVNVGQKGWFWLVMIFGATVGITGVVLDFPIWGQSRFTMQVSHIIHVLAAVLFVGASLAHMYMGSFGVEGVFEGIWNGSVDEVWARQHADLWYDEMMRQKGEITEKPLPAQE
jgi:formate dehydrogenase subunit gamma